VSEQPLAFLYLSQIPYTGLDLGFMGTILYWVILISWSLAAAYLVLFGIAPIINRSVRKFASRVSDMLNTPPVRSFTPAVALAEPAPQLAPETSIPTHAEQNIPEPPRSYSSYDGFKSFAHQGALSVEDIVKGLSSVAGSTSRVVVERVTEKAADTPTPSPRENKTEPAASHASAISVDVPVSTRGFVAALIEGDRAAVFAGLRQYVRGGGAPERLITDTVCLIDDVYRARIDGTMCDAEIDRLAARLPTPMLETLVAALTTAVDSSYSSGITGAKLALTRALAVLGA